MPVFDPDRTFLRAWYPGDLGRYCVLEAAGQGGMGQVFRGQDKLTGQQVAIKFPREEPDSDSLETAGLGGMGQVFCCQDKLTGQRVAIEFPRENLDSDRIVRERFAREMQLLQSLDHPNVVRFLGEGHEANRRYYIMEWVEGNDLAKHLADYKARGHVLSFDTFHTWFRQLCAALQALHDRGIVHRDVKPSNIMVGTDGTVKLLDLGVAKCVVSPDATTQPGTVLGTRNYLAPEQERPGATVDHRADIFALGAVAYEALTGSPLPRGIVGKTSAVNRSVPRWFDALLFRMLQPEPAARPSQIGPLSGPPVPWIRRISPKIKPWLVVMLFVLIIPVLISAVCRLCGQRWLTGLGGSVSALAFLGVYQARLRSRERVFEYYWCWAPALVPGAILAAWLGYLWLWAVAGGVTALLMFFIVDRLLAPKKFPGGNGQAATPSGGVSFDRGEAAATPASLPLIERTWHAIKAAAWLQGVPLLAILSGLVLSSRLSLEFVLSGNAWCARGDYERAIKDYDEAVRLNPKNDAAYFKRGEVWATKGDHDRAIKDYDSAIRLHPENAAVYVARGQAWVHNNDLGQAMKDFSEAIRLEPKNMAVAGPELARPFIERGDVWSALGQYDAAIQQYDVAMLLNPIETAVYINRGNAWARKGDLDRAIKDYDLAIRFDPKDATAYLDRGVAWGQKGDLDREMKDYDEAIRLDPKGALAFINRGITWLDMGTPDQAIKDFDEAIRLDPKGAKAFNNRGNARAAKKEYDRAIKDFDEAIRLDPKGADAFHNRGIAWLDKGEPSRAIEDLDKAIGLNPKGAKSFHNRGIAWVKKGDLDRAFNDFNEAVRLDPTDAMALANRGRAWSAKKDLDRAMKDYDEAIRLDPKNATSFLFRGLAWADKGDHDRAIKDYDEVVRLEPQDARGYLHRGIAYASKGRHDIAVKNYDEAIRLDPKVALAYLARSFSYEQSGYMDRARTDHERAKQLDPDIDKE